MTPRRGSVTFMHPEIGMGRIDRLIIDAAEALKAKNFFVRIVTCFHNPNNSFQETLDDYIKVVLVGAWLPRSFFGWFKSFFTSIRMMYAALYIKYTRDNKSDLVIVNHVSFCIPLIKYGANPFGELGPKILLYCHYPHQIVTEPSSKWISWFFAPFNYIKEKTMDMADGIVVNSSYTRDLFNSRFDRVRKVPMVMNPYFNTHYFDMTLYGPRVVTLDKVPDKDHIFLCLSPFDKKKNIALALRSLREVKMCLSPMDWYEVHLIIAGDYDATTDVGAECADELRTVLEEEDLQGHVTFMLSPEDYVKVTLIHLCKAVVYTAAGEHSALVPLEAMYVGRAVIALESGGQAEAVVDQETGFVCPATTTHVGISIARLVQEPELAVKFGTEGKKRFTDHFSKSEFSKSWVRIVEEQVEETPVETLHIHNS